MVERRLVEFSYDIDEEIIEEDCGFIHKIMSNEEKIVESIVKASKDLDKELKDVDASKLGSADEKLKLLLNVFAKNKGKVSYSFDAFDNGVIRVFEGDDSKVITELQTAAKSLVTSDKEKEASAVAAAAKVKEELNEKIEEWDPEKERLADAQAEEDAEAEKEL